MGLINAVLDEQVDYGFEGGPRFNNEIAELENGFETIDSAWEYARYEYSAQFKNIPDEDRDYIIEVFHVTKGRRHYFKFKDWNDYIATDEPLQVPTGTTDKIQLYKTYSWGQAYVIRPIWAVAFANLKTPAGNPVPGTLNTETGEFFPDEVWLSGTYTWSGEFYVWVRFDNDYNSMTIASWRANTASIELVSRKFEITATNVPASWEE